MAAPEEALGDIILIDSSEDEKPVKKRKRSRGKESRDAAGSSSAGSSRSSKRARLSAASQGSEEGEIDESEAHRTGSAAASATSATANPSSRPSDAPRHPQGAVSVAAAGVVGELPSTIIMPPDPDLWHMDSLTFKLPAFSAKREGSWHSRFQDWVRVFYLCNLEHSMLITPSLTLSAFVRYLDNSSGIKAGKRKAARQAANQANDTGSLEERLGKLRGSTAGDKLVDGASVPQQNTDTTTTTHVMNVNGTAAETRKQRVLTEDEDRAMQLKYFPVANPSSAMCVVCAREGHTSATCPYSACQFCGNEAHWSFSCPTKERCGNCLQFGHTATNCIEKLKLTKGDGLACAFCESPGHLEAQCPEVGRSFHPDADNIKTVVDLPVCCAICGARDHFLSDCSQLEFPPNPTWSLANRSRFIDPNCGNSGIEDASDPRGNSLRATEVRIRGHATRTHIHYSESDDSDVDFLANRLPKQSRPVGRIQVASNLQMPAGNGGRNGNHQTQRSAQPPLPPGPPPPGLFRRQPHNGQRGGTSSLPAKPPPSNRGYHSMPPPPNMSASRPQDEFGDGRARGGHGGRGGRGGRAGRGARGARGGGGGKGRGRGRGRGK